MTTLEGVRSKLMSLAEQAGLGMPQVQRSSRGGDTGHEVVIVVGRQRIGEATLPDATEAELSAMQRACATLQQRLDAAAADSPPTSMWGVEDRRY